MNKVEWISVSDILPVDEGDVLILRKGLNGWDMFVASFEGDYWLINGAHEVIEEGITNIGDNIFKECVNLDTINIPNSVTCIGQVVTSL